MMISLNNPRSLLILGFFMVLFGAVGPFLMVIGVLESTFFMNFLSFIASIVGLFLGLLGISMYRKPPKQ
jgi:hypothetical protein